METPPFSFIKLREHYTKLLKQDTPFIKIFGTQEDKQNWSNGQTIILTATSKVLLVETANVMGSIRDKVHINNVERLDYRLFYIQHGPETYENIEQNLGKEMADTIQKLRDLANKENKE